MELRELRKRVQASHLREKPRSEAMRKGARVFLPGGSHMSQDLFQGAPNYTQMTYVESSEEAFMKIKWYGHAAFLVTSSRGVKIITDPYDNLHLIRVKQFRKKEGLGWQF